jgi:diadenosine tetraphosphate (Ap4A) HIT family hydrolase
MPNRSRREERAYKTHRENQPKGCVFCAIKNNSPQLVGQTRSFKIVRNIFAYSLWDSQIVTDHLIIVPKRHIDSLDKLSSNAATEFLKLISDYEKMGYNVYARAPGSIMKSVLHQHTHLIKTEGKPKNLFFFIRKPFYFRLTR